MANEKQTKAEIIENIKKVHPHMSKDDIHNVLDGFFEELKSGLVAGKTIELRGFGTFEVRARAGRKRARNPKTGENVSVADHSVVFFKAGKELQESVWNI